MDDALSYDLHKLTSRLDRVAETQLQKTEGVSYSRFLALFAVRESRGSQRDMARWLGLSEPSASRMVGTLNRAGLLEVTTVAGAGNRRQLALTDRGASVVERCSRLLEQRFKQLLERSQVSYADYHRDTQRLLDQLDADEQQAGRLSEPGAA